VVERGHTVVLIAAAEHQAYLDEMSSRITEMGGQSLAMAIDCNSLLEVQAMFEATTTQFKNVNSFLHFSKGFGKLNPEVLEFLQDKVNSVTGTTTCTLTDKWISKPQLDEMGQSVLHEEARFPEFVTQRILGIREFESRETYHLVDKEAEAKRAEKEAEAKAFEAKAAEKAVEAKAKEAPVAATPAKKAAPPPPAATPSTPIGNRPAPAPSGTVLKKVAPPPPAATPSADSSSPYFCKNCSKVGNSGAFCNHCGKRR